MTYTTYSAIFFRFIPQLYGELFRNFLMICSAVFDFSETTQADRMQKLPSAKRKNPAKGLGFLILKRRLNC